MPELYDHFVKGGWVMYYGERKGSCIGFDMGLEKAYNKAAKSASGVIGMTARKEAVALWCVVKHEKSLHTVNMASWCGFHEDEDSELDLHHEFKSSSARQSNERVQQLIDYIEMIGSPFAGDMRLRDVCKGVTVAQNVVNGILSCLDIGRKSYKDFIQSRLVDKSVLLHDPIQTTKKIVRPNPLNDNPNADDSMQTKAVGKLKDIKEAQIYIDSAQDRGYDMKRLLSYEITSTSYFLVSEKNKALYLKKNDKSDLSRELTYILPKEQRDISLNKHDIDVTIVDFMAVVRMLPVTKLNLKTYNDFASSLRDFIMDSAKGSSRVDIIFDVYKSYSIKYTERNSRAQSGSGGITVKIKKDEQKLPVDMNSFWESIENKAQLQSFFLDWMKRNYRGEKVVYFGGVDEKYCVVLEAGISKPCDDLQSIQEEADERIAFHIQHANFRSFKKVFVLSNDADVLILLLYHLQRSWNNLEALYMRLGNHKTRKTFPLHILLDEVDPVLVKMLPALHSLSGCDTTSKVGPKTYCLKKSLDLELLHGFGIGSLTNYKVNQAEKFLLSTLLKATDTDIQSFDELRFRQYHDGGVKDFNALVCTSSSIHEHIKRAHYQAMKWMMSVNPPAMFPDPASGYGFKASQDGSILIPIIIPGPNVPDDLPLPCTCKNCTRTMCKCRSANLPCCRLCKCRPSTGACKNPLSNRA